jgi:hypothetical protein
VLRDINLTVNPVPRCRDCNVPLYVIICLPLHVAYVVETSAPELHWLHQQQFTVSQILAHFGALFG